MPVPPPIGLPPPSRNIRSLKRTPQFLALGAAAAVASIVVYELVVPLFVDHPAHVAAAVTTNTDEAASADILKTLPSGNEIPARKIRARPVSTSAPAHFDQPPTTTTTQATTAAPQPPVDDNMTETAIAGRKAAWQAYYQALADAQQQRLTARRAALASDIVVAPPADPSSATPGTIPGADTRGHRDPPNFFEKNASNPATDYSPFTVTNPISPYELKASDTITARLVSSVNSDSPGIIKAIVTKTVTDHATGMHTLIPQGSTLVGVYDTTVAYGQTRLVTAWQRIIYPPPCDQSLDLGAMPGSDQTGQGGFADLTDNHLGKVFTAAILVSVFGAAVQLSQPPPSAFQTYSPVSNAGGAVGQQMAQLGQEFARKGLSIPPTEQVRNGYPFTVMLTRDIPFNHPWIDGVCEDNEVTPE